MKSITTLLLSSTLAFSSTVLADNDFDHKYKRNNVARIKLTNSTQGPLWPPSEVLDKDGNFVLVGNVIKEVAPGQNSLEWDAVIVSKDTVPPLDSSGREDYSNPLGAPYKIVRSLDLRKGSEDLDMELYSVSFGPYMGDFGGGPRMPKLGESKYNLNGAETSCPESVSYTHLTLPTTPYV